MYSLLCSSARPRTCSRNRTVSLKLWAADVGGRISTMTLDEGQGRWRTDVNLGRAKTDAKTTEYP
jgi:hypothetical protein